MFSELLTSEVVWDDELLHNLDSQGGYFQQVTANGEHLAGEDSKQMVKAHRRHSHSLQQCSSSLGAWHGCCV